ncbi:MAG: alanine racemase [Oscillospiraceae bacterium]|jgi:alanine racemase|nr:alanine racemase [Oscillospiraceae bacterium]MCR5174173.1 alanine racemase [Oscillospiraceae bacterium]
MKNLVIDRRVIRNNIRAVKEKADGSTIYADLSANAYGMGLLEMARLLRDEGISDFIISDVRDARQLRSSGFEKERLMMLRSTADPEELDALLELGVICTVGSYDSAVALNGIADSRGIIADVQIKIDTGLGRYGFDPAQLDRVAAVYKYMPNIRIIGTFTTFSCSWRSKRQTAAQLKLFEDVLDRLEAMGFDVGIAHCCDSAALFKYDFGRMDAVLMDLALSGRIPGKAIPALARVGYIEAGLEEVGWYSKGHHIGAEHGINIRKPTKIAVLSVGYYHGFGVDRHKAERSFIDRIRSRGIGRYVRVNNKRAKVLGNIGMQHTLIDVTDIDCTVGDVAYMDVDPVNVKGLPRSYQ